jgi:hypothetical protein
VLTTNLNVFRYQPTGYLGAITRPLLPVGNTGLIHLQPSTLPSLDLTDHERYAFDHFRLVTAGHLHLDTPRAKVIHLVLRLSLERPVFHAIAALGSIHRCLVQNVVTPGQDFDAIRQYGKAISSLQRYIEEASPRNTVGIGPVLCACILLAACDMVKNDDAAAYSHLQFGWRILTENHSSDAYTSETESLDDHTARTIMPVFELLEDDDIAYKGGVAGNRSHASLSPSLTLSEKCVQISASMRRAKTVSEA